MFAPVSVGLSRAPDPYLNLAPPLAKLRDDRHDLLERAVGCILVRGSKLGREQMPAAEHEQLPRAAIAKAAGEPPREADRLVRLPEQQSARNRRQPARE